MPLQICREALLFLRNFRARQALLLLLSHMAIPTVRRGRRAVRGVLGCGVATHSDPRAGAAFVGRRGLGLLLSTLKSDRLLILDALGCPGAGPWALLGRHEISLRRLSRTDIWMVRSTIGARLTAASSSNIFSIVRNLLSSIGCMRDYCLEISR